MSKNVKDYINILGNRLGNAFSLDEFGLEEELQFWALSAEHMSRRKTPTFQDIISWIDLLYNAPVHFVYKKENDKLVLIKRQLITENLLQDKEKQKGKKVKNNEALEAQRAQYIQDFESQLQNLEKKRQWDDEFKEHGISAHTIGNCEHIPLYKKNGENWGIYVVGPFLKSPENMNPKFSIISRLLSGWLIELDQKEKKSLKKYESEINDLVGELGTGSLNTEAFSELFLKYLINTVSGESGAIVEFKEGKPVIVAFNDISDELNGKLTGAGFDPLYTISEGKIDSSEKADDYYSKNGFRHLFLPFLSEEVNGYVLILKKDKKEGFQTAPPIVQDTTEAVGHLFKFRNQNLSFSEDMMETFFRMVRAHEIKRKKTLHHTPRLIAFTDMFGMLFGLDAQEASILKLTAKLHDIGYAGATGISSVASVGSELIHPIAGAVMISNFPVHEDVVNGIKTHHEWVNGKGKPDGLKGEEIPWTGKIISVFEYIVDFIESNPDIPNNKEDEMLEKLKESLIQRADEQFDMVLIPTVIQQLTMLGWKGCVELGIEN